jgi:hypothetical protein
MASILRAPSGRPREPSSLPPFGNCLGPEASSDTRSEPQELHFSFKFNDGSPCERRTNRESDRCSNFDIPRKISFRGIFDSPATRSWNVIGISARRNPA